jgi:hypothetical protein
VGREEAVLGWEVAVKVEVVGRGWEAPVVGVGS